MTTATPVQNFIWLALQMTEILMEGENTPPDFHRPGIPQTS